MNLFRLVKIKIKLLTIKPQIKKVYLNEGMVKAYSKYKEITNSDLYTCIKIVKPWLVQWGYKGE